MKPHALASYLTRFRAEVRPRRPIGARQLMTEDTATQEKFGQIADLPRQNDLSLSDAL